jgi:dTDP-4-dehydrorhamnose 3,5-epimerase
VRARGYPRRVIFRELEIPGVFAITPEPFRDERGEFSRTFCASEFAEHGLEPRVVQCSTSDNEMRGTLRGLHYQRAPHAETKLVRCTRGSVFDVVVDLRPDSVAFGRWTGIELRHGGGPSVYIPRGVAHGFVTMEDHSRIEYLMSAAYAPDAAAGVRWDDPTVGVEWPFHPTVMSERDRSLPDLDFDALRTNEVGATEGG